MLAEMLRTLYGYNRWATEKILDVATQFTPEQFLTLAPAAQRSVRDNLVYLIGTQHGWLSRWDGSLTAAEAYRLKLDPADFQNIAPVRSAREEVERKTQTFLSPFTDADVARVCTFTLPNSCEWPVPLWQMMLYIVNHGSPHCSEAAMLLTCFGHSSCDLDMVFYLGEQ